MCLSLIVIASSSISDNIINRYERSYGIFIRDISHIVLDKFIEENYYQIEEKGCGCALFSLPSQIISENGETHETHSLVDEVKQLFSELHLLGGLSIFPYFDSNAVEDDNEFIAIEKYFKNKRVRKICLKQFLELYPDKIEEKVIYKIS